MITGFNTDVKLADTVYHVQTEDKGTANPLIESLVYVKGAILDSYRTRYSEFLSSKGFSEALLQRILEFQHRQIVGSIRKGKYKKGMELEAFVDGDFVFTFRNAAKSSEPAEVLTVEKTCESAETTTLSDPSPEVRATPEGTIFPFQTSDPPTRARFLSLEDEASPSPAPTCVDGIEIVVEGSKEFKAGSQVDLILFVQTRQEKARLDGVQVLVKVIGTAFSPRLYAGKTDRNGNLRMNFSLPIFTAGSAALILQATTAFGVDEIKYLIKRR
jgi:hypothetical protein